MLPAKYRLLSSRVAKIGQVRFLWLPVKVDNRLFPPSDRQVAMIRAVTPSLDPIRDKVEAGERLSAAEAEMLWDERVDLHELGELANLVRERKNGRFGYYNINTHLNPTNVCIYRCTFCAFRADLREARGYTMSDEQILARGREAVEAGSTEMHIVGGLHHQKGYDWYLNIIRFCTMPIPRCTSRPGRQSRSTGSPISPSGRSATSWWS